MSIHQFSFSLELLHGDACMMLHFGILMKTVVITHPWFVAEQCLHTAKDFSASHAALPRRLGICLPRNPSHTLSLASPEVENTCLPNRSSKWIPCSALPTHAAFALPNEQPLSQPAFFSLLPSQPHPPPWVRGSCAVLSCQPGLNYNNNSLNKFIFISFF